MVWGTEKVFNFMRHVLLRVFIIVSTLSMIIFNTDTMAAAQVKTNSNTSEASFHLIPPIHTVFPIMHIEFGPKIDAFKSNEFLTTANSGLTGTVVHTQVGAVVPGEIVDQVASKYGVNPRLLISLVEAQSSMVTASAKPPAGALANPLTLPRAMISSNMTGFEAQIDWVANLVRSELQAREFSPDYQQVQFADGSTATVGYDVPPGNFVLLSVTARIGPADGWNSRYEAVLETYDALFRIENTVGYLPQATALPMKFPFTGTNRYVGGPHAGSMSPCSTIALVDASAIDFAAQQPNTAFEVLNVADGILRNVAYIQDSNPETSDFGWTVSVELTGSGGLVAVYAHLNLSSTDVLRLETLIDQQIPQGYAIGNAGKTGGQTSIHLHLDLRQGGSAYESYATLGTSFSWEGLQIDGWNIHLHRTQDGGTAGFNYQGSAVQDSSKSAQLSASCGISWGTVGNNYDRTDETNGIDPNTVFAKASDTSSVITSSNDHNGGGVECDPNANVALVSVSSDGTQGDAYSGISDISADGRVITFESAAGTLDPLDNNGTGRDIFVHDRLTCQTSLLIEAHGGSNFSSISANGNNIFFHSRDDNLVSGDTNSDSDWFVHNRSLNETNRVSVATDGTQGVGHGISGDISSDGRYVVFSSTSSKLVSGDTNGREDIFVHDTLTHQTVRVSVASDLSQANGDSQDPTISANGRYITFSSIAGNLDLLALDTNGTSDIFVHDRDADGNGVFDEITSGATRTIRISISSEGNEANGDSGLASISSDGRYVTFQSNASNLIDIDSNGAWDVFIHDLYTLETSRISVTSSGLEANGNSSLSRTNGSSISANGRFVTFQSLATNLDSVRSDTNQRSDIFVHDRLTHQTIRVSITNIGQEADGDSFSSNISDNGRFVAFHSSASNLVLSDSNGMYDVFVARVSFVPDNDNFDNATNIPASSTFSSTWDTNEASLALDDPNPSCGSNVGNTVWYSYVPDIFDIFRFETSGSGFDTVLSVWTGTQGNLTEVACDDNVGFGAEGTLATSSAGYYSSQIDLEVQPGTTYYIMVGGNENAGGILHFAAEPTPSFCDTVTEIPQAECEALIAFYDATGGDNWANNAGWMDTNTPCNWHGVMCSGGGVSGLELPQNELDGTLVSQLSSLSNLEILDLGGNRLSGVLPDELGSLTSLTTLLLENNAFNGDIPTTITVLTNLSVLDLGYNRLSSPNTAVSDFLSIHDPNWVDTQTIPPDNVAAVAVSTTGVEVSWDAISYTQDGGYYAVGYSQTLGGPYVSGCTSADKTITACLVTSLQPDTDYYFAVRTYTPAHGDQLNELWSDYGEEISAASLAPVMAPSSLTASTLSQTEINLFWIDNSIDETAFHVERSFDGVSGWEEVGITEMDIIAFQDAGLACSIMYYYRVRAYRDGDGAFSDYSDNASAATQTCPGTPELLSPQNGTLTNNNRPIFSWTQTPDGEDYQIQIDDNSDFASPEQDRVLQELSYTADTLADGTTFYWRVRASDSGGQTSQWSTVWTLIVDTTRLQAPSLRLPKDYVDIADTTPKFVWKSVQGATQYQLQISNTPGFEIESLLIDIDNLNKSNYVLPDTDSLQYGIYFWRVRAQEASGLWSDWSPGSLFTVTPLKAPKNGDFTTDTTPAFRWSKVAGAVQYQLQVSVADDFASLFINETNLTSTVFTPASKLPYDRYYWRMQVDMGSGYTDNWTPIWTFTVTPKPPSKPILKTPANKAPVTDAAPVFTWEGVPDGDTYQIQIDDQSNFKSPVQDATVDVLTYTADPLASEGKYFWRVRALNSVGVAGQWSRPWSFTLAGPSDVPLLSSPTDKATACESDVLLSWAAVTGITDYQVQVSADAKFSSLVVDAIVTSLTTAAEDLSDGWFYWRVRPVNDQGVGGTWSRPWRFAVDTVGPLAPVTKVPRDLSGTLDTTPVFGWGRVRDADLYRLQVSTDPNFGGTWVDEELTATRFVLPDGDALPYGRYYWQVAARDRCHWGDWSQPFTFTVTLLKAPKDASTTTDTTPTFTWAGAAGYQFQLADNSDFIDPLVDEAVPAMKYVPDTPLTHGLYYWRVSADGGSTWMPAWTVTITPKLPQKPKLAALKNNTLTNDNTPTFSWGAVVDGQVYQLQIDDDAKFGSPAQDTVLGISELTYTALTLPDGKWYWRVRALNSVDAPGPWSTRWGFTVDTMPPTVPVPTGPAFDARVTNAKLKLEWTKVSDAVRYEIQLDTDPLFPLPVIDAGRKTSYTPPTSLAQATYSWRVRAVDRAGNVSAWSATQVYYLVAGNTDLPTETPTDNPIIVLTEQPPLPPNRITPEPPATPEPGEKPTDPNQPPVVSRGETR